MKANSLRKKYFTLLFSVLIFTFILSLSHVSSLYAKHSQSKNKVSTITIVNHANKLFPNVRWVSIKDIKQSLPKKPINVGFDIDDTVIFSSACFYKYGNLYKHKRQYRKKVASGVSIFKLVKFDSSFWNKIAKCDKYSLPKESALNLIKMHQKRGDNIYFITARMKPSKKRLEKLLNKLIAMAVGSKKNLHTVEYFDKTHNSKITMIKQDKLSIYYGDANSDIAAAIKAHARGIRFLRASNSTYLPLPSVGSLGEEVLSSSDH